MTSCLSSTLPANGRLLSGVRLAFVWFTICPVLPATQHCVDGILEVEALHVSERHIVTSHADAHLEKRVQGGKRHFKSDRINIVSDKNCACRNNGVEGRAEGRRKKHLQYSALLHWTSYRRTAL